jgi:type I restriction enzyme S subunit
MKTNMQKYPAYKDSGVGWLGEIPNHWKAKKLKFLGNIYAGLNGKKGDDFTKEFSAGIKSYIPFTNICNNIKISENQFHYVKVDKKENQNRVLKNDILFLMSSETLEDIAKNSIYIGDNEELYLNSFCKGFRISNEKVYPEYINYLFLSATYRSYFSMVGRGFTRINLKQEFINDAFALIPPFPEQTTIAAFLDRKTAFIDQAIGIKLKQIELLKERRQILIHKAVTRGLNPNVKLKHSGVEWIGEIPEGWEVKRIKHLGKIINGFAFNSSEFKDEGVRVMKISNIQTMRIDWSDASFVDDKYFRLYPQFQITRDDLVFALTRPIISTGIKATIVDCDERILLNQRNAVLKPSKYLNKKWIYFIILNSQFVQAFDNQIDKTGQQPNISTYNIGNLEIPFPSMAEQIKISEYLEIQSEKIATAISLKEQEIEKLKEYKATLINSAVTGKIKVC